MDQPPSADGERRVEYREGHQQAGKDPRYRQGQKHQGDKHQTVDHGGGDDLPCAGAAAEHIEHPITTIVRPITRMSAPSWPTKSLLPEERLQHAGPNDESCSRDQIDDTVECCVPGRSRQARRFLQEIVYEVQCHPPKKAERALRRPMRSHAEQALCSCAPNQEPSSSRAARRWSIHHLSPALAPPLNSRHLFPMRDA